MSRNRRRYETIRLLKEKEKTISFFVIIKKGEEKHDRDNKNKTSL